MGRLCQASRHKPGEGRAPSSVCDCLRSLYSTAHSASSLDADSLSLYGEEENEETEEKEAIDIIEYFLRSTEKVTSQLCLHLWMVPVALPSGCRRATGWTELLPSRHPTLLHTL